MKRQAEPWIRDAVATEIADRKLQEATAEPDVTITYYLLLTTGIRADHGSVSARRRPAAVRPCARSPCR